MTVSSSSADRTVRVNIMSAGPEFPVAELGLFVERENARKARAPVISTSQGKVIGSVGELELVGIDVWARIVLMPEAVWTDKRAIGFVASRSLIHGRELIGVFGTSLERFDLERYLALAQGVKTLYPYPKDGA